MQTMRTYISKPSPDSFNKDRTLDAALPAGTTLVLRGRATSTPSNDDGRRFKLSDGLWFETSLYSLPNHA